MSHWPKAVDCTHFLFSPVSEVTERAQPLFSVFRLKHNIVRQLDPSANPNKPEQNAHFISFWLFIIMLQGVRGGLPVSDENGSV